MENTALVALIISAVGMALLFLALALFYGLLSLMTVVFKDRPPKAAASGDEPRDASGDREAMARAAAIAVALARSGLESTRTGFDVPLPGDAPTGGPSPWWALHHQHRMKPDPSTRRE